jgi:hypothetical protein
MGCPWSHPRLADTGWSLVRKFKKVSSSITVLNVVFVFVTTTDWMPSVTHILKIYYRQVPMGGSRL